MCRLALTSMSQPVAVAHADNNQSVKNNHEHLITVRAPNIVKNFDNVSFIEDICSNTIFLHENRVMQI